MPDDKHTPGSLIAAETRNEYDQVIRGQDGGPVALVLMAGYTKAEGRANARRLVACWNACEGIPTAALEDGVVGEMLEALENLENDNGIMPDTAWELVQNAKAKPTGGES